MANVLDKLEFEALKKELTSISDMRWEAFDPGLTRLSEFAVDPYLRRLFGAARHSAVGFTKPLDPGRQTIIRVPSHEVGLHIGPLVQSVILLKLWFAVLWRATKVPVRERTPVVLWLDEFQDLQRLQAIQTILSQARSQGLCLMLSHQATAQLDDSLLRIIIGNAGVQGAGRVSFSACNVDTPRERSGMPRPAPHPSTVRIWLARSCPSPYTPVHAPSRHLRPEGPPCEERELRVRKLVRHLGELCIPEQIRPHLFLHNRPVRRTSDNHAEVGIAQPLCRVSSAEGTPQWCAAVTARGMDGKPFRQRTKGRDKRNPLLPCLSLR
ncbi:MAG: TraM recognition domain-containing protein [Nitrososphaerota archaeon]|nr:TraM recognition domain-containing protein [Nitrososphaerota archaeon]